MAEEKALIFDIQRYSVHDGPGIRTLVFFKGCPLRCKWCQNPESINKEREIAFFAAKCIGCGECAKVCPRKAIVFEEGKRINRALCDRCGKCTETCYAEALMVIGKEYDVPALLDVAERDRPFYRQSGGGITVSGGEPTLQTPFLFEFLKTCKEAGLNTVMETSGFCAWEKLEKLLPLLDFVYFDLKLVDSEKHKFFTGADNRMILENARRLVSNKIEIVFRIPLIPQITATEENLGRIRKWLHECKQERVHLLPYHNMGESKLERIESMLKPLNLQPFTDEEIARIKSKFEEEGIHVTIGG